MLGFWLNQPVWLMFLILAACFLTSMAVIHIWSFAPFMRAHALSFTGVVAPYFGALAVLLALMTGFVANETWEREREAGRVVQSESDNVLAVYDLSIAAAPDMSTIRKDLFAYVEAVVKDEWPRMAEGAASPKAARALGALLQEAARPEIATEAGMPTQAALLNSVLRIRSDRGTRLSLNEHRIDDTKWLVLLILGVLTQIAIGIVQLERPRAQLAALTIFTAGLISTLGLVAIHEWPFDGPSAIKPAALEGAAQLIAAGLSAGPAISR